MLNSHYVVAFRICPGDEGGWRVQWAIGQDRRLPSKARGHEGYCGLLLPSRTGLPPPGNQAASSKQTPKLPAFTLQDKQERTIRDTQCPALSFAVSGAVIMSVCNSTINY